MANLINDQCPKCGYKMDTHTSANDPSETPSPNDISICLNCGTFNKFNEDLKLVEFTQEDLENTDSELRVEIERISQKIKSNKN